MKVNIRDYIAGLIVAITIAFLSKQIAAIVPLLTSAIVAIMLGILLGNTIFRHPIYIKGFRFAESKLLEISVVLLGLTITFEVIFELGFNGILFIFLQMVMTIFMVIVIGKKMKFSKPFIALMASGNAVCGSSAIASCAPVVGADDDTKGLAIIIVNLLGTIMMLVLPIITIILFQDNVISSSALIGGTLQSVGQVAASGMMISGEVYQKAIIFKIMRIILLVFVVLFLQKYANHESEKVKVVKQVPWYVTGFFVFCFINTLGLISVQISDQAHFFSSWFELIALAAIGLRLNIRLLIAQGKRYLQYALTIGLVQIILASILIYFLF